MRSRGQCLQWRQEARLEFKKQEEDIEEKTYEEGSPDKEHYCTGQAGGCQLHLHVMAGQLCRLADQIL